MSTGRQFLAGVGVGTVEAVLVVTPMESMKTKMIERHLDMMGGVRYILHTGGVRGLYQGLTATVLKQASNQVTCVCSCRYSASDSPVHRD